MPTGFQDLWPRGFVVTARILGRPELIQQECMLSIRDLMRVDMARMTEEIAYLHEYLYQVPK